MALSENVQKIYGSISVGQLKVIKGCACLPSFYPSQLFFQFFIHLESNIVEPLDVV